MQITGIIQLLDRKASGAGGNAFTAGSFQDSPLTYAAINTIVGASLNPATGVITLPLGNFWVDGVIGVTAGLQQARLYDGANSVELMLGMNNPNQNGSAICGPYAFIRGVLQLKATTDFTLQWCGALAGSAAPTNFGGHETYADLVIQQFI